MKLGSLFDGSGGFPLAGAMCGIKPTFASEVEPYPIAVTTSRFPNMKHLGSVTEVKGDKIEPVDIITFGSPCQDLSVAGKRAGMKHEAEGDDETTRSGLFLEAVRIIKEMRDATNGVYPRFAVWENVPGAFSSNGGQDFRTVLEKIIQIAEPSAVMPDVPKGGWAYADSYSGDGWSIAYRVFDAQYWGVPQRRRRIYLVADFRGGCARKILFERQGLRGYFTESGEKRQGTPQNAERSIGADDTERNGIINLNSGDVQSKCVLDPKGIAPALYAGECRGGGGECYVMTDAVTFEPGIAQREGGHIYEGVCGTLRANAGDNRMAVAHATPAIGVDVYNQAVTGEVAKSLTSISSDADHVPVVTYSIENHPADSRVNLDESGKVQTLTSRMGTGGGNVPMVMEVLGLDRASFNQGKNAQFDFTITEDGTEPTLLAKGPNAVCYCLQDKSIGRKDANSCNGMGYTEERAYALTGVDRHAVVYSVDQGGEKSACNVKEGLSPTLTCTHGGEPAVAYSLDEKMGQTYTWENTANTLAARDYKQPQAVSYPEDGMRYIVRRLTPTECARLQGFPDKWGHPDHKDTFTKEEYEFWLDVRKTDDAIKGRATKNYTKDQMIKWYNKLHTDASEYKLWGNGIALPCALYVMQGITEVMEGNNG